MSSVAHSLEVALDCVDYNAHREHERVNEEFCDVEVGLLEFPLKLGLEKRHSEHPQTSDYDLL